MNRYQIRFLKQSDFWCGLLALISYGLISNIGRNLVTGTNDFKGFLLGYVRAREGKQFLPGAGGDFARSLGISEYPTSMMFDLPWLFATAVPTWLFPAVFVSATSIAIYIAVNLLGAASRVEPALRRIVGHLLPLLMFLPGPIQLSSVARYTASFGWTLSVLTIVLLGLVRAPLFTRKLLIPLGLVGGCFLFWFNISYLPVTLLATALACFFALRIHQTPTSRRAVFRYGIALVVPAAISLPMFLGVYLFSVWAIPDTAVQENIDTLTSWSDVFGALPLFPNLGGFPLMSRLVDGRIIRLAATVGLLAAIQYSRSRRHKVLAEFSLVAVFAYFGYATIYYVVAKVFDREIGLDPHYLEIFAYPAWVMTLAVPFWAGMQSRFRFNRLVLTLLPMVVTLGWTTQWIMRNYEVRVQPAEYPILLSPISRQLVELTELDRQSGLLSRVIILQDSDTTERQRTGIRRSTAFSETFLTQLTYLRVPVLNAYSHMISPRAFSTTNQFFGANRPTWRQFSLYDQPNIDAMPSLGIRYVLSEVELTDSGLTLITSEPFTAFQLFPTEITTYLYRVNQTMRPPAPAIQFSLVRDELHIKGKRVGPTTLNVPLEFSRCMSIRSRVSDSNPKIKSGPNGMLQIVFTGDIDATLKYHNSIFQWRNCRILDYLDFRRDQALQS